MLKAECLMLIIDHYEKNSNYMHGGAHERNYAGCGDAVPADQRVRGR